MKTKFNIRSIMLTLFAIGMMCNCGCVLVSASTKKENPDGTKTYAKSWAYGVGDKSSSVAAEGMFADGADDNLGAGFDKANSSQESSGLADTLRVALDAIFALERLRSPVSFPATGAKPPVEVNGDTGSTTAASGDTVKKATGSSLVVAAGNPDIVILGNRASCKFCNDLWNVLDVPALSQAACDANVIDADKTENPSVYAMKRPKSAFDWPYVRVYVGGKLIDEFDARGMSTAGIAASAKKAIGECADEQ